MPVAEKEKTRRKRKMEEKTGIRRKRPRCDVIQLGRERGRRDKKVEKKARQQSKYSISIFDADSRED